MAILRYINCIMIWFVAVLASSDPVQAAKKAGQLVSNGSVDISLSATVTVTMAYSTMRSVNDTLSLPTTSFMPEGTLTTVAHPFPFFLPVSTTAESVSSEEIIGEGFQTTMEPTSVSLSYNLTTSIASPSDSHATPSADAGEPATVTTLMFTFVTATSQDLPTGTHAESSSATQEGAAHVGIGSDSTSTEREILCLCIVIALAVQIFF